MPFLVRTGNSRASQEVDVARRALRYDLSPGVIEFRRRNRNKMQPRFVCRQIPFGFRFAHGDGQVRNQHRIRPGFGRLFEKHLHAGGRHEVDVDQKPHRDVGVLRADSAEHLKTPGGRRACRQRPNGRRLDDGPVGTGV